MREGEQLVDIPLKADQQESFNHCTAEENSQSWFEFLLLTWNEQLKTKMIKYEGNFLLKIAD